MRDRDRQAGRQAERQRETEIVLPCTYFSGGDEEGEGRERQTDRQTEKKRKMEGKTENSPQRKRSRPLLPRTQGNEFPNNAHLIGPELKTLSVCKASDDNNFSWCFCFSK